jgi:hypothetical protein
MQDAIDTAKTEACPEAVIAGTLCLMSCYVQQPVAIYAERVADNLTRMAGIAGLSPELRTICRRLAQRWEDMLRSGRAETTAIDERSVH